MALQFAIPLRNQWLSDILATGANPRLLLFTGAKPSNCAAADTGDILAYMTLPSIWLASPVAGVITKSGTWSGDASFTGVPGYFRIKDTTFSLTIMQGTVTAIDGGGDMEVDVIPVVNGQPVTVTSFQLTAPGA